MSLQIKGFEFGEFYLEAKGKNLLRQRKSVPLTPKALLLLSVLVENHGQIVEKEELMKRVWAESFVEESNLTFTISLLRKALNNDKQNLRFIETVSKRGYRFSAEVKEIIETDESESANFTSNSKKNFSPIYSSLGKFLVPLAFFGCLLIGLSFVVSWYVGSKNSVTTAPVLSAPFALEKLSTDGRVFQAVISPDGKNVVYSNGTGSGQESVWLRELETGNNIEIIPPSKNIYGGFVFSPDNAFIYFARMPLGFEGEMDIYRISIFGGVPVKIIGQTQGWFSISPDNEKISFVRCPEIQNAVCSLRIADAGDGKNEREIVSRQSPFRIGDNSFAPDGKSIVFVVGHSLNASNELGINEIDLESGAERQITEEKFFEIKKLAWLQDKSNVLITASKIPNKNFRIWQISYPTGDVTPLTKDSENYLVMSLDKKADAIISTQFKQDFHLKTIQLDNPSGSLKILADATTATFAPNGKLVYSSVMSGNEEIWTINADGGERRQLTNNPADDVCPVVSPDGNSIYFAANRTGAVQVWRMNFDGTNQAQITDNDGGFPLAVSSDGQWIYYHHGVKRTLWRVSAKDYKNKQEIFNQSSNYFAVSPDGSQAAFSSKRETGKILKIIDLINNGQVLNTFPAPDRIYKILWMADSKGLIYQSIEAENNARTFWRQSFDMKIPQKVVDLGDEQLPYFAVSTDGKSLAVIQGRWLHDAVLLKGLK